MDRRVLLAVALLELCLSRAAFAAEDKPEVASSDDKRRAQELYDGAMKSFDQDDYESALRGFQSSYQAVKSPNSHFMVARSLARLGRNVEAYKELTLVIEECDARGARYADTAQAAYAKRDEVKPRIGLLTVTMGNAPKGTEILIGDEKLPPKDIGKPIAVLPGETKVVAVTPDGKTHTQKVTLRSGTTADVALNIPEEGKAKAKPIEPPFDELAHPKYTAELAVFVTGETASPSDTQSRGAGPGARLYVNILPKGLITELNDSFAVGAGVDWIASSQNSLGERTGHFRVPVTAQWNFWLVENFSIDVEAGANLVLGTGTHLQPTVYAGARYVLGSTVALTAKAGIPDVAIGLSVLF